MIRVSQKCCFPSIIVKLNDTCFNRQYRWQITDYQSTSQESLTKNFNRKTNNWSNDKDSYEGKSKNRFYAFTGASISVSYFVALLDLLGIKKIQLDDDPLKDKIKQARVSRTLRNYADAISILHEALQESYDRKDDHAVTYVIDELANTYYEKGDKNEADINFREVLKRLIQLHQKTDDDPAFIGISLKLADLYAQKGEIENADIGFRHCVTKQMKVMEEHLKKFHVNKGASVEAKHLIEAHGNRYSDPIALFGMCLETYAHFLVQYGSEKQFKEAEEYMDEVLKISSHIYGISSYHLINVLNNFGALCILKNRFDVALKYLEIGIERILYIDECAPIIAGYYCNYAEALFHTGNYQKSLEYARKAANLSQSADPAIKKHVEKFVYDIERSGRRMGNPYKNSSRWSWFGGT